jgi:hypothetical protein
MYWTFIRHLLDGLFKILKLYVNIFRYNYYLVTIATNGN